MMKKYAIYVDWLDIKICMSLIGLFDDLFLDCRVLAQHRFVADVVLHPRKDNREIFHHVFNI